MTRLAGMMAKSAVAPLDRLKILMQSNCPHYSRFNLWSCYRAVLNKEGFLSFYKGNGAAMIRVFPYAAIQYTAYELFRPLMRALMGPHSHIGNFTAGAAAGTVAVTSTYPLDIVRTRLAFQVKGEHVYYGIMNALQKMFHENGWRAYYKGYAATVAGILPYSGSSFYFFDLSKRIMLKYFPKQTTTVNEEKGGRLELSIWAKLICGCLSGVIAQTAAYPVDVIRRRMQLIGMHPAYDHYNTAMWRVGVIVYHEEGMSAFYRGLSLNYVRAIPMVGISFTAFEFFKQLLRIEEHAPTS
ncbi:unnamed protein product [Darwinula stevensoni]|uniref:Mitochondrial carrier protein n=1 Tax=Darwinula stevensoni TaxID=69355 RepID=A0A7R9A631_9CRUS|nr:unnamed protein product [Darwinula stevensoni]CAG0886639.1 unnamed protein product [Darwinula stevensoni]